RLPSGGVSTAPRHCLRRAASRPCSGRPPGMAGVGRDVAAGDPRGDRGSEQLTDTGVGRRDVVDGAFEGLAYCGAGTFARISEGAAPAASAGGASQLVQKGFELSAQTAGAIGVVAFVGAIDRGGEVMDP